MTNFKSKPIETIKEGEPISNSDEIRQAFENGEIYKRGFEDARKRYERPKGKWITLDGGDRACPFCNMGTSGESNASLVFFNYCPYCGADMRVKDELKEAENE